MESSREELMREVDVQLAMLPLIIELADLAIEHSTETTDRIQADMARYEAEREEALDVLRHAGLLRD